jgi:hypothetical protein
VNMNGMSERELVEEGKERGDDEREEREFHRPNSCLLGKRSVLSWVVGNGFSSFCFSVPASSCDISQCDEKYPVDRDED